MADPAEPPPADPLQDDIGALEMGICETEPEGELNDLDAYRMDDYEAEEFGVVDDDEVFEEFIPGQGDGEAGAEGGMTAEQMQEELERFKGWTTSEAARPPPPTLPEDDSVRACIISSKPPDSLAGAASAAAPAARKSQKRQQHAPGSNTWVASDDDSAAPTKGLGTVANAQPFIPSNSRPAASASQSTASAPSQSRMSSAAIPYNAQRHAPSGMGGGMNQMGYTQSMPGAMAGMGGMHTQSGMPRPAQYAGGAAANIQTLSMCNAVGAMRGYEGGGGHAAAAQQQQQAARAAAVSSAPQSRGAHVSSAGMHAPQVQQVQHATHSTTQPPMNVHYGLNAVAQPIGGRGGAQPTHGGTRGDGRGGRHRGGGRGAAGGVVGGGGGSAPGGTLSAARNPGAYHALLDD